MAKTDHIELEQAYPLPSIYNDGKSGKILLTNLWYYSKDIGGGGYRWQKDLLAKEILNS
jgi:hypothetical protein